MTKKELNEKIDSLKEWTSYWLMRAKDHLSSLQKITSDELKWINGEINKLKSDSDKGKNVLNKIVEGNEKIYEILSIQMMKTEALFEFSSMLSKALNLDLKVTPATEEKREIIIKSKKKKNG